MSPRIRPHRMPLVNAKIGRDTRAMLRAVADVIYNDNGYPGSLDDAVWALARGVPKGILSGVPLDRSVYLTAPAENGVPNARRE